MDLRIGHLNIPAPTSGPRRTNGASQFAMPEPKASTDIPAAPPPDVLREIQAAGARAEELWNARRELHFEVSDAGRVVIQVRDTEGHVIRTIPPSEALDIMSGRGI
jgi:flagellar protein FlaG